MNKNILTVLLTIGVTIPAFAQQANRSYKITGTIKGQENYKMIFAYFNGPGLDGFHIDTNVIVKNGKFTITGELPSDHPVIASISSRHPGLNIEIEENGRKGIIPSPGLDFILAPNSKLNIEGEVEHLQFADVIGDHYNKEFNEFKRREKPFAEMKWQYVKQATIAQKEGNTNKEAMYNDKATKEQNTIDRITYEFVQDNPDFWITSKLLNDIQNNLSFDSLVTTYNSLAAVPKGNQFGKAVATKIAGMKRAAVGSMAPEFKKLDKNGQTISLADYRGKYVLLDFWGTWCSPCMASMPHLKELYKEYHKKGLEIIGIAQENGLDNRTVSNWKKVIREDDLSWIQILNDEGQNKTDLLKLYGVTAFPSQFLISSDGKILIRHVDEDAQQLDQMLKEIFDK